MRDICTMNPNDWKRRAPPRTFAEAMADVLSVVEEGLVDVQFLPSGETAYVLTEAGKAYLDELSRPDNYPASA